MNPPHYSRTVLERAFELAEGGGYRSITEIANALRREGFVAVADQLEGVSLRRQLRTLMTEARRRYG